MGILEFLIKGFKSEDAAAEKPEILFDTLEVEYPLVKRLHMSKVLQHSEVPVYNKEVAAEVGCSVQTWSSLNQEQKQDFISDAMNHFKKQGGFVYMRHKGVKLGREIVDQLLVEDYVNDKITKVLIGDRLISIEEHVKSTAETSNVSDSTEHKR